jgi:hypothetical protein
MGYVKYRSDEERTEARRLAKERKQEFFNTPEGKRWKKNTRLKSLYGITLDEYERMLEAQGHKCWCCGVEHKEDGRYGPLCVDHNHTTGDVRGLLCRRCNMVIGNVEESKELLTTLIDYLEVHNGTSKSVNKKS